ncbi:MAG TPA: type IV pilus secretin PilQ [Thermodesulfovibrionales bacterium]|nr:type IV pilus secretin PilQ [Thermodesulfovibrionales bacterium]
MRHAVILDERCAEGTELLHINKERSLVNAGLAVFSALWLMLIVCSGCATTRNGDNDTLKPAAAVVTGIDIQDNAVRIAADKPFIYTIYKPGDPYRMIIDLPDVSLGAFSKKIVSSKAGITEISPSQSGTPTLKSRLEILLQSPSSYEQEYKNNVLTVRVKENPAFGKSDPLPDVKVTDLKENGPDPVKEARPEAQAVTPEAVPPQTPLQNATEISGIGFEQSGGNVKLVIKGNGSMVPNVFPLDNRIVIDIPDVTLKAAVPDTVISPVKGIRSGQHDDKVRLVLDLKEETRFDVSSIGDSIVVSLRNTGSVPAAANVVEANPGRMEPATPEPEEAKIPTVMTGTRCENYLAGKENVNFDFQDQDIVPILRLFADISGCNMFLHPDVKGRATMKFRDVPWTQALDTILKTFSLDKSIEGNIIRIAPLNVFAKEREEKVKAQEAQVKAEPLETKIFPISYADVGSVEAAIRQSKILTARGSLNVDKRTSTMLVKDIASVFPEIENLLQSLDKPTAQVMIEARIVEVNTNTETDLGIQWGINISAQNTLSSIGGLKGVPLLSPGAVTGKNYLVDFPATAVGPLSGSGVTFGIIDPTKSMGLDLQISAIETMGKLKVVSNPKVLTVDNEKAKILQGKSIPVRKLTTEGTVSTEFKDVTLELTVTPHITPDGSISMSVEIKKEDLDPTVPSVEGVPGTDKKEANTKVIIKDGETIVIGGLYKVTTNDSQSGVPGLMNIPVLGWLFRSNATSQNTSELLIFITPRILGKH